mmetsp:Transcript_12900/g.21226  ORF Transcript_12900/g.21226 Transcript_12900/m.21226 type:complete len:116 (-) Transcript_12900:1117-1464(-)
MPRTAGAGDKSQRTRRKQTEAERKQRNERKNAKKKEDQQKEKEDAERARPANTFFMLRSTIQQRSNDNDDNCNGIDNKMMFSLLYSLIVCRDIFRLPVFCTFGFELCTSYLMTCG